MTLKLIINDIDLLIDPWIQPRFKYCLLQLNTLYIFRTNNPDNYVLLSKLISLEIVK